MQADDRRRDSIDLLASEHDRERAFRRARRHTLLVRALRLALPLIAVASLGLYAVVLFGNSHGDAGGITVGRVSIDPSNLAMADPRYSGFGSDGSEYRVHAARAVTDLRMSKPIRLEAIAGEIIQPTGIVTRLTARWGTYDQGRDQLELHEQIDIDASNGMTARLTRATVLAKESRILSPEPVVAETPTGAIRASTMALDTKARTASFRQDVEVTLKPQEPPTEAGDWGARTIADRRGGADAFGLDANSSEPIVVTSERLDVDDGAKTALFRDAVVARQGEALLEAPELDVIYHGEAGPSRRGALGDDGTRLKAIRARGGVTMTNRGDRASSHSLDYDAEGERIVLAGDVILTQPPERRVTATEAVFDQRADTALLTGRVEVSQGRNVMRGERLTLDRRAGTARLASPAGAAQPQGRVWTLLHQGTGESGRPAAKALPDRGSPRLEPLGAGFRADPQAPIEVEAVTLDVDDRRQTAVYTGAVVARQGDFEVRSQTLSAHYTGRSGLLAEPTAKPAAKGGPEPAGMQLRRIEASGGVEVKGNDGQRATGDWANFDVTSNTVVMGGNVVVAQGKQMVRAPHGMRLVIELDTGVTRFAPDPGARPKAGAQLSGAFATSTPPSSAAGAAKDQAIACPPGAVCNSGRLEAIFYPNDLQEQAKGRTGGTAAGASGGAGAARTPPRRLESAPAWSATTRPNVRP